MKTNLLMAIALLAVVIPSFSQNNFWKPVEANEVSNFTKGKPLFNGFAPSVYKLFSLDENTFGAVLKQSPQQADVRITKSNFIINIPVADGSIERFKIVESPVMSPVLQAKYPEIKTYAGQGIDDPSSAIRFDFSPHGFHAIIISPKRKTIYINPVSSAKQLYVVFDRSNISQEDQVFDCKVDKILGSNIQGTEKPFTTSDGNLRTYRFAVATGGEFSQLCLDGSETTDEQKKASVLSVLVTELVRTNAIFETDLGIHLNYVDNEDDIIFLDKDADPFISDPVVGYYEYKWNKQSQKTIDSLIGSHNYDIGHLLMGYNTGGDADCIGCVCNNPNKGSGVTGSRTHLKSDPFIVDFWDHEIGHQFGANHTFDYQYEGTIAQMEPGSASTIMGYAGVTGLTDIQQHSDPYFHAVSIQQIENYITAGRGSTCAVVTSTGDAVPTANAGKDFIIPKSTPFQLTAKATDADAQDVLTYCWEQYDDFKNNGTSYKFPRTTSTTGPVFRSITPSLLPDRTFPSLINILDGTNSNKWEVLPSVTRTLNFRLTVRDNHPDGGSSNSDDMAITVDGNSGPFKVTVPNTNITVGSGSAQTVKWDVANTNTAPVNCNTVNILLSIDGGFTFPYLLAANTPNDGSQNVTFPIFPNTVTTARIKIAASANIFFDISDANFSISGALPLSWVSFSAERSGTNGALIKWSTANEINNDHFEIEKSTDAVTFTAFANIGAGTNTGAVQNYFYTDVHIPFGTTYYRIKQVDKDGRYSYTKIAQVTLDANGISWNVMPNPATDHTTIVFNTNASDVHVYLTDASGKIVYKNTLASVPAGKQLIVPVNNLTKGVYILRVNIGNEIRTQKIIKD